MVWMIVEMIARQIGEGGGGDPHAVEPVLIETVRRRLQRQMRDALARQLRASMQFDRIGRGQRSVDARPARPRPTVPMLAAARARPDLARERRDGSLAAGAGDRGDRLRLTRKNCAAARASARRASSTAMKTMPAGKAVRALLGNDRSRAASRGVMKARRRPGSGRRKTESPARPCGCPWQAGDCKRR